MTATRVLYPLSRGHRRARALPGEDALESFWPHWPLSLTCLPPGWSCPELLLGSEVPTIQSQAWRSPEMSFGLCTCRPQPPRAGRARARGLQPPEQLGGFPGGRAGRPGGQGPSEQGHQLSSLTAGL